MPELAGAPDARNLWPQPFSKIQWNAYVKDELELHFHRLACEGTIDLVTAQREIATDWIAAHKQYFTTDRPLRDDATSPLTERDTDLVLSELEEMGLSPRSSRSQQPTIGQMMPPSVSSSLSPLSKVLRFFEPTKAVSAREVATSSPAHGDSREGERALVRLSLRVIRQRGL